jgi:uncharacterized integral membrane protein (TIGR00698 family)
MSGTDTRSGGVRGDGSSRADASSRAGGSSLVLVLAGAFCVIPWSRVWPPLDRFQIEIGLGLGIALALAGLVHAGPAAKKVSRYLIQACVVLLGFRMDLHQVVRAGAEGLVFAAATIVGTFALGALLGRVLRTPGRISTLLSSGTAICGGSAIAAVSSVIGATSAELSVSTAIVFILNGAALYLFPFLGELMHFTPHQFGTWAGVAIHDVSSVVGAAQSFGHDRAEAAAAVDVATVVKLSRVLWIVPICVVAAEWVSRQRAKASHGQSATSSDGGLGETGAPREAQGAASLAARLRAMVPWFIAFFVLAAAAKTACPEPLARAGPVLFTAAKSGMALALFLIGAGLSRKALASVGWRPLVQGVLMWVAIGTAAAVVVAKTGA